MWSVQNKIDYLTQFTYTMRVLVAFPLSPREISVLIIQTVVNFETVSFQASYSPTAKYNASPVWRNFYETGQKEH